MGVYIKGMEMPISCDGCPLIAEADDYHVCYINEQFIPWEWVDEHSAEQRHPKPSWCPLIEVPPHGRLIDADALTDAIESTDWYHQAPNKEMVHGANSAEHQAWYKEQDIYSALENAPTIIEAEEGEG